MLHLYRVARWLHMSGFPRIARLPYLVLRVMTGATIPPTCQLGTGTKIAYGGSGVVVHARAVIGNDCLLGPGVIVGGRAGKSGVPRIGDRVKIYAHAQLLGDITIGPDCTIGPGAIVIESLPPGAVVVAPLGRRL